MSPSKTFFCLWGALPWRLTPIPLSLSSGHQTTRQNLKSNSKLNSLGSSFTHTFYWLFNTNIFMVENQRSIQLIEIAQSLIHPSRWSWTIIGLSTFLKLENYQAIHLITVDNHPVIYHAMVENHWIIHLIRLLQSLIHQKIFYHPLFIFLSAFLFPKRYIAFLFFQEENFIFIRWEGHCILRHMNSGVKDVHLIYNMFK